MDQAKLPDKNYDVDGVMNELMKVIRKPEYASREFIATFAMTLEITGKSIPAMFRTISLLKHSPEIQTTVSTGNLPQGVP